jgi:hypothetical protein
VAVIVVAEALMEGFYWCPLVFFCVVCSKGGVVSSPMMQLFMLGVNTSLQNTAILALYVAAFVMLVLV